MRLEHYLTEGYQSRDIKNVSDLIDVCEMIKKDCAPWLKEFNVSGSRFFRGTNINTHAVMYRTARQDRRPKDSELLMHYFLDEWSKKKWGWKWRSEGVYTSTDYRNSLKYGNKSFLFFPVGAYSYLYNKDVIDIADFSITYEWIKKYKEGDTSDKFAYNKGKSYIEEFLPKYTDKGLKKYQNVNGHHYVIEVVWKCSGYYLIDVDYHKYIKEYFLTGKIKDGTLYISRS